MEIEKTKKVKIDLKDRKILSILDWDARATNTQIGKEVMLSKKAVEYRIKRLERLGVIEGYYPVIDFMKLGYYYGRIFIKLQYCNLKKRQKIEDYIKKDPKLKWSIWTNGEFDLVIAIWSKTIKQIKDTFHSFNSLFSKEIKEYRFSLMINLDHYPSNFLMNKRNQEEFSISEVKEFERITNFQIEILKSLSTNARKNITSISKELETDYKIVSRNLNYLFDKKILIKNRAILNLNKLGYNYYKNVIYLSNNFKDSFEKIKEFVKKLPETTYIVDDLGMSDFDFEIVCLTNEQSFNILDSIQNKFPNIIKEVKQLLFKKTIKITYLPFD